MVRITVRVGVLSPRSRRDGYVRSHSASPARSSCDIPNPTRASRNTRPNALATLLRFTGMRFQRHFSAFAEMRVCEYASKASCFDGRAGVYFVGPSGIAIPAACASVNISLALDYLVWQRSLDRRRALACGHAPLRHLHPWRACPYVVQRAVRSR
jgi:hypothetical protein